MPNQLSELLMDDSFVRFLKRNASEEEEARWSSWIQQEAEHAELVAKARALLDEGTQTLPKPDAESERSKLMERIDSERRYQPFQDIRKRNNKLVWATMAAAASILLVIGFLARQSFLQNDGTEDSRAASITYRMMDTEPGQKTTVQYSDGSEIVINANTQMRLPETATAADTMQVWLEGEALFDITRKPASESRTFIVHTPDGDVSVLGTKFAVNTTKAQSRVVLAEGRVRVDVEDSVKQTSIHYTMTPGEMALFSPVMDEIKVQKVNPKVYTSWASDTLVMDDTPLSELIERIEFTYDVKVLVEDKNLLDEKLTGRFDNLDLKFLLKGLAKTLDVDITKRNKTVYIRDKNTGSFSTES